MKKNFIQSRLTILFVLCTIIVMGISCNRDQSEQKTAEVSTVSPIKDTLESIEEQEPEVMEEPRPIVTYHLDSIATAEEVDSFHTRYSEKEKKLLFALNRMDAWRLSPGSQLIIPDSIQEDFLAYSPFPEELDLLDSIPKTILINQRVQGIALYENGKLIRWGPTSSGKKSTPTPNGLHYGNHKSKRKVSTVNPDWILPYYFNFMNFEGVGVHQYSMPGYPASHACVRLLMEDAKFIYSWAEQWELNENQQVIIKNGTPFMVFGQYDYESPITPWLRLAMNNEENFLNEVEMDTLRSYVKQYYQDDKNFVRHAEEEKPDLTI